MTNNTEGWKTPEAARHHLKTANILTPDRQETITMIARLATEPFSESPRIMDIGCGYGDVTAEILERRPQASVCMIDYSDEMIKMAEERFGHNPRIEILRYDLNDGLPEILGDSSFDAVVSAYALHHTDYDKRPPLYAAVKRVLTTDGIFATVDRFKAESAFLADWEFDNWVAWMSEQVKEHMDQDVPFTKLKQRQIDSDLKLGDKPGTVWDMQQQLREAGFKHADCLWKKFTMALIAGTDRQV